MKRMESGKKSSKSSSPSSIKIAKKRGFRFAVCLDNEGYLASLERGKLYRVLPDAAAAAHGYLRVIDESGEDYAYAAERFFAVDIPRRLERSLAQGAPVSSVR